MIILTRGEFGASFFENNQMKHIKAAKTITIDTVGAGDTFIGSYIYSRHVNGLNVGESVQFAVKMASYKCSVNGFEFGDMVL